MDNVTSILLGITSSLIASIVFWLASFKITRTNVQFSSVIAKSKNTDEYPGKNRYRIKIINSGSRDLIEIVLLVKISIERKESSYYTYVGIGNENKLPILRGKKFQCENVRLNCAHILTLYPINATLNEYKKNIYTERIRTQAIKRELCLEDIFNEYGNDVSIKIFVYGNDALTGARKMFTSKEYKVADTEFGKYKKAKAALKKRQYVQYIIETLTFIKSTEQKIEIEPADLELEASTDIESI
jgi:hypothetical protein